MSYPILKTAIDAVQTTLAANYVAASGTMQVAAGTGVLFGSPSSGSPVYVYVSLSPLPWDSSTTFTIYSLTGVSTDTLTITLAYGTDQNYASGSTVMVADGAPYINDLNSYVTQLQANSVNASNLTSGTVPTSRLGSGTASSSTFLRGDSTWASGSQGPQGFQGSQGVQGYQGLTGPQGAQGNQGGAGSQGSQGSQGFQGVAGATGAQGYQGNQGFQGVQGYQGNQGVQGAGIGTGTVNDYSAQQYFGENTLTDASSISWNLNTQQSAVVTLGGNRTLANPSNSEAGGTYTLVVIQDGTGSRTLSYGSNFKWPGGTAPTLSTSAGAVDVLTFLCHGSNLLGVCQKGFA